jgi:hypothetical protein
MAHFSRSQGRWLSRPRTIVIQPDPYDANSPSHSERHRETLTMHNGIIRVDIGEPIK